LTAEERAQLEAIEALPDDQIDYSDAPYLPDAQWVKAQLPRTQRLVTLRVDPEVLDFFKHTGKQYHSRMSEVLRSYFEAHKNEIS
jgi:uncharacterized protein (DUF4415 family)